MITEFGKIRQDQHGYYIISTNEKGLAGKKLHRLLYCKYNNCTFSKETLLKMSKARKGKKHSEETKRKMSIARKGRTLSDYHIMRLRESHIGLKHSEETKKQMSIDRKGKKLTEKQKRNVSKSKNTTGFFRVSKAKRKSCKQGFYYVYSYYEGGKRKAITATNINKLKEKVVSKGLEWYKFDKTKEGGMVV